MEEVTKERAIDNEFITELIKDEPSFETLSFLLKSGADINAITQKNGYNCLMDLLYTVPAIKKSYKPNQEQIKFLIENGADLNYCDPEGFSVVHCMDIYSLYDELLFLRGANPNIISRYYGTPLDMIQQHLDYDIEGTEEKNIQILKSYGGKPSIELETKIIRNYISITLDTDIRYCFMSVDGFLKSTDIPGLKQKDFEGLVSSYNTIISNDRTRILNKEKWGIEANQKEINGIMGHNDKLIDISKEIKMRLSEKIRVYVAYFEITPYGISESEFLVEPGKVIEKYIFQNPENPNDCF